MSERAEIVFMQASTTTLKEFVASKTGTSLYDESSKLWWNGPFYRGYV